jgi:transposase-like protein
LSKQELARRIRHRLAIIRHAEEATGNVALTCRYYGISRQTYYEWYRRFQEHGTDRNGHARGRAQNRVGVSPRSGLTSVS